MSTIKAEPFRYGAWHGAEIEYVFNTLEETRQESGFTEQENN